METLPAEVLKAIIEYAQPMFLPFAPQVSVLLSSSVLTSINIRLLPLRDLKPCRLVSKSWDATIVPLLYEQVFLSPRYADIERFQWITSRFKIHVKRLIFSAETFALADWREYADKAHRRNLSARMPQFIRRGCQTYSQLRDEKAEMLANGVFLGVLSGGFCLPRLEEVVLSERSFSCEGYCYCLKAYLDGHRRSYNPWSFATTYGEDLLQMVSCPEGSACSGAPLDDRTTNFMDPQIWPLTMLALHCANNTTVKTIKVSSYYAMTGPSWDSFYNLPQRTNFCARIVMANLVKLDVAIDVDLFIGIYPEEGRRVKRGPRLVAAAGALSAAINLESLIIDAGDVFWNSWEENFEVNEEDFDADFDDGPDQDATGTSQEDSDGDSEKSTDESDGEAEDEGDVMDEEDDDHPITTFRKVLHGCTFPKLTHLNLKLFTFGSRQLIQFAKNHPQLRQIVLNQPKLIFGRWDKVVRSFKRYMELESFRMYEVHAWWLNPVYKGYQLYDYNFNEPLEEYIKGIGANPFSPKALEHIKLAH